MAVENHQARMQRVLDYIDRHLHDDLTLEVLSSIAAYSKYHFHRQFTAIFGVSVHRYILLSRMKLASYRLVYRGMQSITDIALDAGYDAPDAFARAFRQRFGQSPESFRKSPHWGAWHSAFTPLDDARSKLMQRTYTNADVTIRHVLPTPVAIMEHRGDPAALASSIQRFIAWRQAFNLHPRTSSTFNVWRSERRPASLDDYSVDLCVGVPPSFEVSGGQMKVGEIPGGRCAVLRVVGNTDNLERAALYMYRDWLPASGEDAGDFPLYCQRLSLFPEVPESEAVAELFLPLK